MLYARIEIKVFSIAIFVYWGIGGYLFCFLISWVHFSLLVVHWDIARKKMTVDTMNQKFEGKEKTNTPVN